MSARHGYQPFPTAKPLCFLHVQKTGGASAIAWLESMFPADRVAPCRNPWEFEALRHCERGYDLYAGHILGGQIDLDESRDLFTILRDPAQIVVSSYHHHRHDQAPKTTSDNLDTLHQDIADLCRDYPVEDVLALDHPAVRFSFWNTLTRFLGATQSEHFDVEAIGGTQAADVRARQIAIGRRILQRALVVGDHRQYAETLLLVAAERGWPSPPMLPRFHDFGVSTNDDAARTPVGTRVREISAADYVLYDFARPLISSLQTRLIELCGAATAQAVDARHARLFFAESPVLETFSADADAGWAGHGWSFREQDGDGNLFRRLADERSAVILARIAPGRRRFRLRLWNVGEAALEGLAVHLDGQPLARAGQGWDGPALYVDWALPESRPDALTFIITKPEAAAQECLWVSGCAVLADD